MYDHGSNTSNIVRSFLTLARGNGKALRILSGAALAVCLLSTGCKGKSSQPGPKAKKASAQPAAKGLDEAGGLQLSAGDRCPVCGMKVGKHKRFASGIVLADGTTFHFCGTGCLLKSWLQPQVFLGHPKASLGRAVTREYFGGAYVDAKEVRWVVGSDVVGAMGPAIVPLKSDADAATFRKRHGGRAPFRLADLSVASWSKLTGKGALGAGKHGHGKHGHGKRSHGKHGKASK